MKRTSLQIAVDRIVRLEEENKVLIARIKQLEREVSCIDDLETEISVQHSQLEYWRQLAEGNKP